MKAICVKQPFASLIADGYKTIETRVWETNYRGKILICISKSEPDVDALNFRGYQIVKKRPDMLLTHYTNSVAIAVADLVDVRYLLRSDCLQACCAWYPGYAWVLENVQKIRAFTVQGKLRLFTVEHDIEIMPADYNYYNEPDVLRVERFKEPNRKYLNTLQRCMPIRND